jgi:hypothetical protein
LTIGENDIYHCIKSEFYVIVGIYRQNQHKIGIKGRKMGEESAYLKYLTGSA